MLTSSDSCSMMLVMSRASRKMRLVAALTSMTAPSPLAATTVFAATRSTGSLPKDVFIAPLKPQLSSRRTPAVQTAVQTELQPRHNRSLRWMRPRELRTARLLRRFKLHQLHPRQIRIKHVKLPFSVPSNLRPFVAMSLPAVRFHDPLSLLHVHHTQRDVIQHARKPQIRMLRLIQHILQPVSPVRNLDRHPIRLVGLHAPTPVRTKAQQVTIKVILHFAAVHQKPGMNHVP